MEVDGNTTSWVGRDGAAAGDEYEGLHPAPGLRTTIDLDDDDLDARVFVSVAVVLYVVASWIGLLALAEVFRSGATLQDLERSTI